MFRETLSKVISNCEGAVAVVVMGFDGIAVDSQSQDAALDIKTVGMEFSFVLGQVRKAAEILEVGGLQEVSIRSERLTFLIRVIGEEHFIGLALRPDGNYGKGRFLLRMAADELSSRV